MNKQYLLKHCVPGKRRSWGSRKVGRCSHPARRFPHLPYRCTPNSDTLWSCICTLFAKTWSVRCSWCVLPHTPKIKWSHQKIPQSLLAMFQVNFTTTLFALIRENLKINVRESSEMDQADIELRTTIIKCWPHTKRDKIDLLVPTPKCK